MYNKMHYINVSTLIQIYWYWPDILRPRKSQPMQIGQIRYKWKCTCEWLSVRLIDRQRQRDIHTEKVDWEIPILREKLRNKQRYNATLLILKKSTESQFNLNMDTAIFFLDGKNKMDELLTYIETSRSKRGHETNSSN